MVDFVGASHALAPDVGLFDAGWLPAMRASNLQICNLILEANTDYHWIPAIGSLDVVSLKSLPQSSDLLAQMYADNADRASSTVLFQILDSLFELTGQKQFNEVDVLLLDADVQKLAPEFSVGLLRATANYSQYLIQWTPFLNKVQEDLERRGLPHAQILAGLPIGATR